MATASYLGSVKHHARHARANVVPVFFPCRCKNIMKVARTKLELIKPDEVNMEEYEVSKAIMSLCCALFRIETKMSINL